MGNVHRCDCNIRNYRADEPVLAFFFIYEHPPPRLHLHCEFSINECYFFNEGVLLNAMGTSRSDKRLWQLILLKRFVGGRCGYNHLDVG